MINETSLPANDVKLAVLPVIRINPSPYQVRKKFDMTSINELAESIKQNGLIQPVVVRQSSLMSYELVAGERRLRACKIAGIKEINVIVINASDEQSALLCMIENVQRQQLHFFEVAQGYMKLIQIHSMTQNELAIKLGLKQSTIANKIRLLRLDEVIKGKIIHHNLTERHARALLRLPNNQARLEILEIILDKKLNVKACDDLIHHYLTQQNEDENKKNPPINIKRIYSDWRLLNNSVKSLIKKMRESGTGIKYNLEDVGPQMKITILVDKAKATSSCSIAK